MGAVRGVATSRNIEGWSDNLSYGKRLWYVAQREIDGHGEMEVAPEAYSGSHYDTTATMLNPDNWKNASMNDIEWVCKLKAERIIFRLVERGYTMRERNEMHLAHVVWWHDILPPGYGCGKVEVCYPLENWRTILHHCINVMDRFNCKASELVLLDQNNRINIAYVKGGYKSYAERRGYYDKD